MFHHNLGIETDIDLFDSNANRNIQIEDEIIHIEADQSDFYSGIYLFDGRGSIYEYSLEKWRIITRKMQKIKDKRSHGSNWI